MRRQTTLCSLLLVAGCLTPLAAQTTNQPRSTFSSSLASSSVETLSTASGLVQNPETSTLRWGQVSLASEGKAYTLSNLEISFEAVVSYDSPPDIIMTLLNFKGEVSFDGGRSFKIEPDNVGVHFARALYLREKRAIKFLLPALFVDDAGHKPGHRFNSILAFECSSDLETCQAPRSVLVQQLRLHGRPTIAEQDGLKARSITSDVSKNTTQKADLTAGCCHGVHTGKSKCAVSSSGCKTECSIFLSDACPDCCELGDCMC